MFRWIGPGKEDWVTEAEGTALFGYGSEGCRLLQRLIFPRAVALEWQGSTAILNLTVVTHASQHGQMIPVALCSLGIPPHSTPGPARTPACRHGERDRSPEERHSRRFNSAGDEASLSSGVSHHTAPVLVVTMPPSLSPTLVGNLAKASDLREGVVLIIRWRHFFPLIFLE